MQREGGDRAGDGVVRALELRVAPALQRRSRRRRRALRGLAGSLALLLGASGAVLAVTPSSLADTSSPVMTGTASKVTSTSATVSGVGTLPVPVLYTFEYDTDGSFSVATASFVGANAAAGGQLSAELTGLAPGTTYYFRLVGIQGPNDTYGGTASFATASGGSGPPGTTTTTTTPPSTTTTTPPSTTTTTTPSSPRAAPPGGSAGPTAPAPSGGPPAPITPAPNGQGYWLVTSSGVVTPYGDAGSFGDLSKSPPPAPIVALTPTPDGEGYWLLASDGTVYAFGDAQLLGSATGRPGGPAVGVSATPDGKGYWVVTAFGTVYPFGDAGNFGSAAGVEMPSFVVGMSSTPDGQGYWLVLANGAVLNFGDAAFYGSAGGIDPGGPVVSLSPTQDGRGYWELGSDGSVYAFGDAKSFGSPAGSHPASPLVAMTPTADGQGYWLASSDGTVYPFGDAPNYPLAAGAKAPGQGVVAMSTPLLHVLAGVPMEYVVLDQEAAATCPGLPWEILTAIGKVESDFGRSTLPGVTSGANSAGAAGPMQMGIGGAAGRTFFAYDHPVRGDRASTPAPPGSVPPSPYNPADAVFAAARDLCTNGGGNPDSLNAALLAYNHAQWYANEVMTLAAGYAGSSQLSLGTSPAMAEAVHLALSQIGVPYSWGGSTPGVGFDCSGLVQWAYRLAGIALPRTSYAQWAALPHLPAGAPLEVGDLLFFEPSPEGPGHVGIYIGNGLMVDAPHTGATVRIESYNWSSYVGAAVP